MSRHSAFSSLNSLGKKIYFGPWQTGHSIPVSFDPLRTLPGLEPLVDVVGDALDLINLPDSDVETAETDSPAESVSLEYRIVGLTWHTPDFVNTCHMDSFLSAFVRQVRQTHGSLLSKIKHLDPVGKTLLQIGEHALHAKNLVDSTYVKKLWLQVASDVNVHISPFDAQGREEFSVFQHLYNHAGFYFETVCLCGPQYLFEFLVRGHTLTEIYAILCNQTGNNEAMPLCQGCNMRREFVSFKPVTTNWMITVQYLGHETPDFADILQVIVIEGVMYKLLYIGYRIPGVGGGMGHVVSAQMIRGWWYKYDGSERATFVQCFNQLKFDVPGALLSSLVYFKV